MPFVSIKVTGRTLGAAEIALLQEGTTRLMAEVMRKRPELTAVAVEQLPAGAWSVEGRRVTVAAHLDAKVTAGTNTPEEKARFVAEANRLLRRVLGEPMHEVGYVVVHELAGDAWGWNGLTQAERAVTG